MNHFKKWLIGTLVAGAIIAGSIIPEKQKEEPLKREPIVLEKTINFDNPQRTLNEAFALCKPEHLSEIIYDPDFKSQEKYIKERLVGYSRRLIDEYLQQAKTEIPGHDLCVADILAEVGDGKKRIAFCREKISKSIGINCLEDLASCIFHEDTHARESRYGYDFGDKIIQGKELIELLEKGEIRTEVIRLVGEFDAYSSMIERAEKTERKPSPMHVISATTNLYQINGIIERAMSKNTLTALERKYAETKLKKHKETIETLKKYQ